MIFKKVPPVSMLAEYRSSVSVVVIQPQQISTEPNSGTLRKCGRHMSCWLTTNDVARGGRGGLGPIESCQSGVFKFDK